MCKGAGPCLKGLWHELRRYHNIRRHFGLVWQQLPQRRWAWLQLAAAAAAAADTTTLLNCQIQLHAARKPSSVHCCTNHTVTHTQSLVTRRHLFHLSHKLSHTDKKMVILQIVLRLCFEADCFPWVVTNITTFVA